jgi:hypothetical protein
VTLRVGVVTVSCTHRITVEIQIGLLRIYRSSAAIISPIAELWSPRVAAGVGIVTVVAVQITVSILILFCHIIIHGTVGLFAVTYFLSTGVGIWIVVVAVSSTDRNTIVIGIFSADFKAAITVIVQTITELELSGMKRGIGIVAITGAAEESIFIGIGFGGIESAGAIVVETITQFLGTGINGGIGIVAVFR